MTESAPPALHLPGDRTTRTLYEATVVDGVFVASGAIANQAGYAFVDGAPKPIETTIYAHVFPSHAPEAKHIILAVYENGSAFGIEISSRGVQSTGALPGEPRALHTSASNDDWLVTDKGALYIRPSGKPAWSRAGQLPFAANELKLASLATTPAGVWVVFHGAVYFRPTQGGEPQPIPKPSGVGPTQRALTVYPDREGRLWFPFVAPNDESKETTLVTTGPVPRRLDCNDVRR
jgi:hypothetical protein